MLARRGEALLIPEIVVANESLDLADTPAAASAEERTEGDWRQAVTDTMWAFKDAFVAWARENLGEPRVDYRPQSYIGIRYGRRVWAPLWPRKDGAYVYLPDPDGSRDQPSLAFEVFEARLREEGLNASWSTKYNAGANPIALRLGIDDLGHPAVQELLRASHEALRDGARPYSESAAADGRSDGEQANSGSRLGPPPAQRPIESSAAGGAEPLGDQP